MQIASIQKRNCLRFSLVLGTLKSRSTASRFGVTENLLPLMEIGVLLVASPQVYDNASYNTSPNSWELKLYV
jgi:hypothetical protein